MYLQNIIVANIIVAKINNTVQLCDIISFKVFVLKCFVDKK